MGYRHIGCGSMDCIDVTQDRDHWKALVNSCEFCEVLEMLHNWWTLQKSSAEWSWLVSHTACYRARYVLNNPYRYEAHGITFEVPSSIYLMGCVWCVRTMLHGIRGISRRLTQRPLLKKLSTFHLILLAPQWIPARQWNFLPNQSALIL
jgi:hypothetical protein